MYEDQGENLVESRLRPQWLNVYIIIFFVGLLVFALTYILYIQKVASFWPIIVGSVGASLVATSIASWLVTREPRSWEKICAAGVMSVFIDRARLPPGEWHQILLDAKRECNILGIALRVWIEDKQVKPAIKATLAKPVPIKVLFLDPMSETAKIRAGEERMRDSIHAIADSISRFWELRESLPGEQKERLDLRTYKNTPTCSIIWTDNQMIVTNYVVSADNVDSPGCVISDVSPSTGLFVKLRKDRRCLFDVYRDNFNRVLETSQQLTQEIVDRYRVEILNRG